MIKSGQDTVDLLTKRFKRADYSDLSKQTFNGLNGISNIPHHKSSLKYQNICDHKPKLTNARDMLNQIEKLAFSGDNSQTNKTRATSSYQSIT